MQQPVKFKTPYQAGTDVSTIYSVDPQTRSLRPYDSAEAYQEAGFKFGDERLVGDPGEFRGYSVGAPISRSQQLAQIKNELNSFQDQAFQAQQQPPKRQASLLQDSIAKEDGNLNSYLEEFNALKTKLTTFQAPNFTEEYGRIREEAGIPAIEKEYADVRKTRRELPYVERANTGNAGIATENQLREQVAEKDIPFEVREANLIDRLKLASEFATNAIKLKELDFNTARESLANAINLVSQSINLSQSRLQDLQGLDEKEQARRDEALKFGYETRISKPFFDAGGTVYRTSDLRPAGNAQEYVQMGGKGDFSDVQKLDLQNDSDQALVMKLAQEYPDAGIRLSDTLEIAQSKLSQSKIYKQQTRLSGGGGGTTGGADTDQYADAVFSGRLKLNSVPTALRAEVDRKVQELQKSESDKYDTEFEARLDYDQIIKQLNQELSAGESLTASPTEVITQLANKFGKYVSKQEIESTVLNLIGVAKPRSGAFGALNQYGIK